MRLLPDRWPRDHWVDIAWCALVALVYLAATYLVTRTWPLGADRMMILAERMTQGHLDSPSSAGTVDSVAIGGRFYMAVGRLQAIRTCPSSC